jgi:hypothetical protein
MLTVQTQKLAFVSFDRLIGVKAMAIRIGQPPLL